MGMSELLTGMAAPSSASCCPDAIADDGVIAYVVGELLLLIMLLMLVGNTTQGIRFGGL